MTSNGRPPGSRIISIYDYPEHLNPFYEDDNHNKIRFWTQGRKKTRSNSFSLAGIRNAMTMRSFRGKKDLKASQSDEPSATLRTTSPHLTRSTQSIPVTEERSPNRYLYGRGSVTPTPSPRMHARDDAAQENKSNSRLSLNNGLDEPGRPPRVHRKKRRAPPPPPMSAEQTTINVPEIKPDDEVLQVVLKIEEDSKETSEIHDERTDKLVAGNAPEDQKEETIPTVELKIVEDNEDPPEERLETGNVQQQVKSPIVEVETVTHLQITEQQDGPHDPEVTTTTNMTEVSIWVNEATVEESAGNAPKPIVSVSSAEIMVTDTIAEEVKPTPKTRTICPSLIVNNHTEENVEPKKSEKVEESETEKVEKVVDGETKNKEEVEGNVETKTTKIVETNLETKKTERVEESESKNTEKVDEYELDMEAKLLADMEELDKSTHQIKEWLEELNDSSKPALPVPVKDDTNNNVKLSPSHEDSPKCK